MMRMHHAARAGVAEHLRMRHVSVVVLASCAFAALALGPACDGKRDGYVAANDAIMEVLPRYPHAERVSREIEGIHRRDCSDDADCPIVAWATHERHRLPPGTTGAQVLDFYLNNLPRDWTVETEEIMLRQAVQRGEPESPEMPTGDFRIQLRLDLAFVGITTCVTTSCDSAELLIDVDHRYYAP